MSIQCPANLNIDEFLDPWMQLDAKHPPQTLLHTKNTSHGTYKPWWHWSPQQNNVRHHTTTAEERDKELKVLHWPLNSPDPNLTDHPLTENSWSIEAPSGIRLSFYLSRHRGMTSLGVYLWFVAPWCWQPILGSPVDCKDWNCSGMSDRIGGIWRPIQPHELFIIARIRSFLSSFCGVAGFIVLVGGPGPSVPFFHEGVYFFWNNFSVGLLGQGLPLQHCTATG